MCEEISLLLIRLEIDNSAPDLTDFFFSTERGEVEEMRRGNNSKANTGKGEEPRPSNAPEDLLTKQAQAKGSRVSGEITVETFDRNQNKQGRSLK